jgi:hypothetical protein
MAGARLKNHKIATDKLKNFAEVSGKNTRRVAEHIAYDFLKLAASFAPVLDPADYPERRPSDFIPPHGHFIPGRLKASLDPDEAEMVDGDKYGNDTGTYRNIQGEISEGTGWTKVKVGTETPYAWVIEKGGARMALNAFGQVPRAYFRPAGSAIQKKINSGHYKR